MIKQLEDSSTTFYMIHIRYMIQYIIYDETFYSPWFTFYMIQNIIAVEQNTISYFNIQMNALLDHTTASHKSIKLADLLPLIFSNLNPEK